MKNVVLNCFANALAIIIWGNYFQLTTKSKTLFKSMYLKKMWVLNEHYYCNIETDKGNPKYYFGSTILTR